MRRWVYVRGSDLGSHCLGTSEKVEGPLCVPPGEGGAHSVHTTGFARAMNSWWVRTQALGARLLAWGCDMRRGTLVTAKLGHPSQKGISHHYLTPGFADEKAGRERMLVRASPRVEARARGENQALLMSSPGVGDLP